MLQNSNQSRSDDEDDVYCMKKGHNKQLIQSICLNNECRDNRPMCKNCFYEHRLHLISTLNQSQFDPFRILSINSQQPHSEKYLEQYRTRYQNINQNLIQRIQQTLNQKFKYYIEQIHNQFETIWKTFTPKTSINTAKQIKKHINDPNSKQFIQNKIQMLFKLGSINKNIDICDRQTLSRIVDYHQSAVKNITDKAFNSISLSLKIMKQQLQSLKLQNIDFGKIIDSQKRSALSDTQVFKQEGVQFMQKTENTKKKNTKIQKLQKMQTIQKIQKTQKMQKIQRNQKLQKIQKMQRNKKLQKMQKIQRNQKLQKIQRNQKLQKMQKMQNNKKTQKDNIFISSMKKQKQNNQDNLEPIKRKRQKKIKQHDEQSKTNTYSLENQNKTLSVNNFQLKKLPFLCQIVKKQKITHLSLITNCKPDQIVNECVEKICQFNSLKSINLQWANSISKQSVINLLNKLQLKQLNIQNCNSFDSECVDLVVEKLPNICVLNYGVDFRNSLQKYHQSLYFMEQQCDESLAFGCCVWIIR